MNGDIITMVAHKTSAVIMTVVFLFFVVWICLRLFFTESIQLNDDIHVQGHE